MVVVEAGVVEVVVVVVVVVVVPHALQRTGQRRTTNDELQSADFALAQVASLTQPVVVVTPTVVVGVVVVEVTPATVVVEVVVELDEVVVVVAEDGQAGCLQVLGHMKELTMKTVKILLKNIRYSQKSKHLFPALLP